MKVLILDDHPMSADTYKKHLENYGFNDVYYSIDTDEFFEYVISLNEASAFLIDYNITESIRYKICHGGDLVKKLKVKFPKAIFVIFTLVDTGVELYYLKNFCNPTAVWFKGDVTPLIFTDLFQKLTDGYAINTPTVQLKFNAIEKFKEFDELDIKILLCVFKHIPTHEMPSVLNTSQSTVNARKALIKIALNVESKKAHDFFAKCIELNLF